MSSFRINKYNLIDNFKRKGRFEMVMKYGFEEEYEHFTGTIDGNKVKGMICLKDDNIYKLTLDE